MSDFLTIIPVDIKAVKDILPTGSDIEGVEWNAALQQVELRWSNRRMVTPFTIAESFPIAMLQEGAVPKSVKMREPFVPAPEPEKTVVDTKPPKGVRKVRRV